MRVFLVVSGCIVGAALLGIGGLLLRLLIDLRESNRIYSDER